MHNIPSNNSPISLSYTRHNSTSPSGSRQPAAHRPQPSISGISFAHNRNSTQLIHGIQSFIGDLYSRNPAFRSEVDIATNFGRNPLEIRVSASGLGSGGQWNTEDRRVEVNLNSANAQHIERAKGTALFELLNASADRDFQEKKVRASQGEYEREAEHWRSQGYNYVTGSQLYARDLLEIEWKNMEKHHSILKSALNCGMQISEDINIFSGEFGHLSGRGSGRPTVNVNTFVQHQHQNRANYEWDYSSIYQHPNQRLVHPANLTSSLPEVEGDSRPGNSAAEYYDLSFDPFK